MTQQEYNNQGFEEAATRYGYSPVLAELERINERCAIEAAKIKQLAMYTPPAETGQVQPAPVVTLEMKRYFAAGGFTTFCVVVIAAAEQGAFAAAATVGGYIAFVGAGIGLAWVVLRSCFTWSPNDGKVGQTSHSANPQNINVTVNVAGQNVTNGK